MQLNLSGNKLCGVWLEYCNHGNQMGTYTAEGIIAISDALRVNGGLTCCNVLMNKLDLEAANLLVEAVKSKDISLCGIKPEQTSADFKGSYGNTLSPPDAVLLSSDLSKAGVTGRLKSVWILGRKSPPLSAGLLTVWLGLSLCAAQPR